MHYDYMAAPASFELLGTFTILTCILFSSLLAFMFIPSLKDASNVKLNKLTNFTHAFLIAYLSSFGGSILFNCTYCN